MKVKLLSIIFVFAMIIANAQSLTYEDLINLQTSSLDKATGFFTYKGFTWFSSTKDKKDAITQNGYSLTYDQNIWKFNYEEVQFDTKTGHENCVCYITTENNFSLIENEAKIYLTIGTPEVKDNMLQTYYHNKIIGFSFNIEKINDNTYYDICVNNPVDMDSIINSLCSYCKGIGQIIEYKKCNYCNGSGKEICSKCNGSGKFNDQSILGQPDTNGIYKYEATGATPIWYRQIHGAWQWTPYNPPSDIWMPVTTTIVNGGNFNGLEPVLANKNIINYLAKNNPNYEKSDSQCTKCKGTGHTDIICSYCGGTGLSSEKVTKICPVCNGTKLKVVTTSGKLGPGF